MNSEAQYQIGMPDWIARGVLLVIMALLCVVTWQKWGSLTVDCGREMYIPAVLSEGKRLYFDEWYLYGPLIPYWHALLFRIFGINLAVLYASGIAIVAIISFTLYSLSRTFLPVWLSFTAVFAFLLQAFQLSIFNYVLPYSYPAAYGAVFSVLLLWLLVRYCFEDGAWRIFLAGMLAGLLVLTKVEFGVPAYAVLASAISVRAVRTRSIRELLRNAALCLPGFMICAGVYWWLVSMSSFEFIFGDNLGLLPSSYFARTCTKMWTELNGFSTSPAVLIRSAVTGLAGAGLLLAALWFASRSRMARRTLFVLAAGICASHLILTFADKVLHLIAPATLLLVAPFIFFNPGLIWLSIVLLFLGARDWRQTGRGPRESALLLLALFAAGLGLRILTKFSPAGYPVFFDTLPYLAWLVALYRLSGFLPIRPADWIWKGFSVLLCCGVLALTLEHYPIHRRPFLIRSSRGNIYTPQSTGEAFVNVLAFLNAAKARSEPFVVMPEEMALYFFSGTTAPNRRNIVTPCILPTGEATTQYLAALDRVPVRYVILSDRATPEYGTPLFGRDYDRDVHRWLQENFTVTVQIGKYERVPEPAAWGVIVYERRP
jgi:hypothetical protein